MKFLLDTNVVAEFAKEQVNPGALDWLGQGDEREIAISVITIGEIKKGMAWLPNGRRQRDPERWLESALLPRPDRGHGAYTHGLPAVSPRFARVRLPGR